MATVLCMDARDLPHEPGELFSEMHVVTLPMVTRFRGITERELMVVKGPAGWAEFSPFVEYQVEEASRWLRATVEAATTEFPTPVRDRVRINATVPACPAHEVGGILDRFPGAEVVKVKIAARGLGSVEEDLERVSAVLRLSSARIRLDANGAYSVSEAVNAIRGFTDVPGFVERVEYIEQPCARVEDLVAVREQVDGVRIAADESIRKAQDPLRVARLGAADHIVVKVQPLGGVRAAIRVVEKCGLPATVSSALESSVGLSAGVALAASLEDESAAGLGTAALLSADVVTNPLRARESVLPVGRVEPSQLLLEKHRAQPARTEWWVRRLRACWARLREGRED
ncbi:O-succinylbenzoate synthase [Brevibacterium paucivorans]|uniref:o-succinylbenzoate synthase n=2 Tax=Brevibacterium paucivorans TaxID=170994 RepID=A0A2N6VN03_9MICO|nr:O-succinylbenzoate synthase [Brevibacterium paucivorans]